MNNKDPYKLTAETLDRQNASEN